MPKATIASLLFLCLSAIATEASAQNPDSAAFNAFSQGDYERAFRLTEDGIARKEAGALWLRGLMLASGAGVEQDNRLAIEFLEAGVKAGATYGLTLMGNIYQEGGYGVARDILKAAELYERGANEGYADAQWLLGELYLNSNAVGINPGKAAELFAAAARQEHPEALFSLAALYKDGRGVAKNPSGAADLLALSAIGGNSEAALLLARMLETGDGIPENADDSAFYYVIAAELGNAQAQAPADEIRKSMSFRIARQIAFKDRIDAWFAQHGLTRGVPPSP